MRILVIERDARTRASLDAALRAEGHEVATASSGADAYAAVSRLAAEIVLCDAEAAAIDGATFVERCRARDPHTTVIMTGRWGNDEMVLGLMRAGAYDFIPKPFRTDHVVLVVRKAVDEARLRGEVQRLREELLVALSGARINAVAAARITPGSSPAAASGDEDLSVKRRTATLERTLIRRALERTGGNRTRAARLLDLSHRALLYKIREYGLHQG